MSSSYPITITQHQNGGISLKIVNRSTILTSQQIADLSIDVNTIENFNKTAFDKYYADSTLILAKCHALDIISMNCEENDINMTCGSREGFATCNADLFIDLVDDIRDNMSDLSIVRDKYDEKITDNLRIYDDITNALKRCSIPTNVFQHIRDIIAAYYHDIIHVSYDETGDITIDISEYKGHTAFARDIICWTESLRSDDDLAEIVEQLTKIYQTDNA